MSDQSGPLRSFAAVIFDLDGVLTDTAQYHFQAWRALAASLDIQIDHEFNETLKGVSRMASLERILARGEIQLDAEQMQRLATQKNDHYQQLIAEMDPDDLLPGALACLELLQEQNIPMALASASQNAPFILQRLGLAHFFQGIADPTQVIQSKPHPAIFLAAAQLLDTPPRFCLGVEDAPAGIAAIKSAGMYALGVGKEEHLAAADEVIEDLRQFDMGRYRWRTQA